MKTILLTLLLTGLGLRAQTPAAPSDSATFAPLPGDNSPDTNRDARLQQALQKALAGKPAGVIDQRPANSTTNVVLPGAVALPTPPARTALTPNQPAAPVISPAPAPPTTPPGQPAPPTDLTAVNPAPAAQPTRRLTKCCRRERLTSRPPI